MKNKIIIILVAPCFIILGACKKFLVVNPETNVSQGSFYKSQSDFEQAITGTYAQLQFLYNEAWQLTELRSDNTYFIYDRGNRGTKPSEDFATFTVETNNNILSNSWRSNYLIISRANQVLSAIDNVTFDQSAKDNLKGQALFLRSLAYYNLVKTFGNVPLFLTPATSYEETFKPQVSVADLYEQIVSDTKEAASLLPVRNSNTMVGRVTSGAAHMLLGDIFINLRQWADAEYALRPILGMGYDILPDFADIYKPSNKGNDEIIFEINYIEGTSQALQSTFPYAFLPKLSDPSVITDVKPGVNNIRIGSFNTPTPDLISAFEDTSIDRRFSSSIGFYSGPSPMAGIPIYTNIPYIKKFQHSHAISGQTNQNWIEYRYAETLLLIAESLNEQDKPLEALTYLNKVRHRAGLSAITSTDKPALRDIILHERRVELAFENKRWHDLVRTSKAVSVMNAFGEEVKTKPSYYYYAPGDTPPPNSFNVTQNSLLYPIPITEIIINPSLIQNPGY